MKAFKKFFALLLALLMTVSLLATTAMADDPPAVKYPTEHTEGYKIVIKNAVTDHKYYAFQIFKGTLDTKGVLSDITWGDGVNPDALLNVLTNDAFITANYPDLLTSSGNPFSGIPHSTDEQIAAAAQAVVNVLSGGWMYYEKETMAFADLLRTPAIIDDTPYIILTNNIFTHGDPTNNEYVIKDDNTTDEHKFTTGYYLIVDYADYDNPNDKFPGDGASDHMLLLNRPNDPDDTSGTRCVIAPKVSVPTFTKTVHSSVDGTYGKFVDSEISDKSLENIKDDSDEVVPNKLTALGTSNAVWFKLEATMPNLIKNYKQYHVLFEDMLPASLKPILGSSKGNIYLLHGTGGKTDLVDTQIDIQKLDEHQNPIPDDDTTTLVCYYKVTLDLGDILPILREKNFNTNDTIVIKYAATLEPGATFGTDDPNTNNAIMRYSNDMNQTVAEPLNPAEHNTLSHADLKLGTLTSSASVYTYQATFTKIDSVTNAPLGGAEFRLFRNRTEKYTEGGVEKEHLVPYYAQFQKGTGNIIDWVTKDALIDNEQITSYLISAPVDNDPNTTTDGTFVVSGLDAMTYHLEETAAPAGYDKMKQSVVFTIETAKDSSTLELTGLSMTTDGTKVVGDLDKGTVTGNVRNTPGKVLPGTGGIGTTIFYIVGGVLVMGAAAAFVTKRRNEA